MTGARRVPQPAAVLRAHDGTYVPVWAHAHAQWQWSKDAGCWVYYSRWNTPPSAFCFGERYVHANFGVDSFGLVWTGSTSDNWHGFSFGVDLTAALQWVREAKYTELECAAWGTE